MIPDREARPYDLINPTIPRVARRVRKSRLEICRQCQYYTGLEQCALCGCFMPAKVMLPHASCPDGRWLAEVVLEAPSMETDLPPEVYDVVQQVYQEGQQRLEEE